MKTDDIKCENSKGGYNSSIILWRRDFGREIFDFMLKYETTINNQIIRILTKFEMNLIIIYISLLYFILVANILKVIDEAIVTQISIFGLIPSTLSILLTYKPSRSLLLD